MFRNMSHTCFVSKSGLKNETETHKMGLKHSETFGDRNISVSSLFLNQHFGIWEDGSHGQGHDALEHAWAVFTSWEDTRDDPSHNHDVIFAHSCTHIRPEHRPHRPRILLPRSPPRRRAARSRERRRQTIFWGARAARAAIFGVQEHRATASR